MSQRILGLEWKVSILKINCAKVKYKNKLYICWELSRVYVFAVTVPIRKTTCVFKSTKKK